MPAGNPNANEIAVMEAWYWLAHCWTLYAADYDWKGSKEDIDKVIQMGVEAGMASTMERLDELLVTLVG